MSGLSNRNAAFADVAQRLMQASQFWAAMQEQRDEARRQRKWQEKQQKEAEKKQGMGAMIGGGSTAAGAGLGFYLGGPAGMALGAAVGAGAGIGIAGATGNSPFTAQASGETMSRGFSLPYEMEMQEQKMGMEQERLGLTRRDVESQIRFRDTQNVAATAEARRLGTTIGEIQPGAYPSDYVGLPSPGAAREPPRWQQMGLSPTTPLSTYRGLAAAEQDFAYANRPMGREPIQFSPEDIDAGVANLETMLDPIAGDPQGGDQRHFLMQDYLDRVGPKMDPAHRSAIVNRWNRKYGYWPRAKNPPTYNLMLGPGQ